MKKNKKNMGEAACGPVGRTPEYGDNWCSTLVGGPGQSEEYPYIHHLLEFQRRVNLRPAPTWLQKVATPMVLQQWTRDLAQLPDQAFRGYILSGIANGFQIGFSYQSHRCSSAGSNMQSTPP